MLSNKPKLLLCGALLLSSAGMASAQSSGHKLPDVPMPRTFAIPTQPLAAPPGMVPMIVYVPAQQMQPAAVAPHIHAPTPPQAAQTINVTHCSINDVAVLTKDAPSCQKAGGVVKKERASFAMQTVCQPGYYWC